LLDAGVDIEASSQEDTPLIRAVVEGDVRTADLLISRGAKVSQTIFSEWRFQDAVRSVCNQPSWFSRGCTNRRRYFEVIQLFLEAGVDANETSSNTKLPLLYVVLGNPKVVALLLAAGADCNIANRYGYTLLHFAIMRGGLNVVEQLLAAGADVNARCFSYGKTAMHRAVDLKRVEIVARLLAVPELDMNAEDRMRRRVAEVVFDLYLEDPQAFRDEGIDIQNSQVIFLDQRRPPIPLDL
jgi:ankyrin repeat protein